MRTLDKTLIKSMEAVDYRFSSAYANWGYSNFATRNLSYYNNPKCRADDAFIISVSIQEPPTLPNSVSLTQPHKTLIPYELVQAYASLFNSKDHSDVVFVIHPSKHSMAHQPKTRRLYAIKKILSMRSEYFSDMFQGGWSESEQPEDMVEIDDEEVDSDQDVLSDDGDFSDVDDISLVEEEEEAEADVVLPGSVDQVASVPTPGPSLPQREPTDYVTPSHSRRVSVSGTEESSTPFVSPHAWPDVLHPSPDMQLQTNPGPAPIGPQLPLRHKNHHQEQFKSKRHSRRRSADIRRSVVHITDTSYSTFRGVLYWIYTDYIHFAELSSTYHAAVKLLPASTTLPKRRAWSIQRAQEQREESARKSTAALVPLVKQASGGNQEQLWLSNAKRIYKLADSTSCLTAPAESALMP